MVFACGLQVWSHSSLSELDAKNANCFSKHIDVLGAESGIAQSLNGPITTLTKLLASPSHITITYSTDSNVPIGYIKYGSKDLYFYKKNGEIIHKINQICLLDFYVSESMQRGGIGLMLFQSMLCALGDGAKPALLAYDRPSAKLLRFAAKHFNLTRPDMQPNKYTIFEGFAL